MSQASWCFWTASWCWSGRGCRGRVRNPGTCVTS